MQQSPIDLCGAQDLDRLPQLADRAECLNFMAGDDILPHVKTSYGKDRATSVRLGSDGLNLKVEFLEGEDLKLKACALPVRVGRYMSLRLPDTPLSADGQTCERLNFSSLQAAAEERVS